MKISFRYIKDKDIFEMQVVEPQLRAHFLLTRDIMNNLRVTIENAILDSYKEKKGGTGGADGKNNG